VRTISVTPDVAVVVAGDTVQLAAAVRDSEGASVQSPVEWASLDQSVATVDAKGVVHGLKAGTTKIVVVAGSDSASVPLEVTRPVTSIVLSAVVPESLVVGNRLDVGVRAMDASGTAVPEAPLHWSSSNPDVVTVDYAGRLHAAAWGDATLTLRVGAIQRTFAIRARFRRFGSAGQWAELGVGRSHACAIPVAGGIPQCWGRSAASGVLGVPLGETWTPSAVIAAPPLHGFAVGAWHSCGLAADSTAWCWGAQGYRGTGQSPPVSGGYYYALQEPTLRHFARLDSDGHGGTCGIDGDDHAWCWGHNDFYQLGRGPRVGTVTIDTAWRGLPLRQVALGDFTSCAITNDGAAWCSGVDYGQLGTGVAGQTSPPVPVTGGHSFVAAAVTWVASCGLTTDGKVLCWGSNDQGSLGTGEDPAVVHPSPTLVASTETFGSISAADHDVCALTADGRGFCWGANDNGQLASGAAPYNAVPGLVSGPYHWRRLAVGAELTCGITTEDELLCWGAIVPF
jgi:hypothetical protein